MTYTFKFKFFGKKVQMFRERQMGVVVEKERDVVCVYCTDRNYHILYAVPLCHPKFLKGAQYSVTFEENDRSVVSVVDYLIVFDYARKQCTLHKALKCYGTWDWEREAKSE